MPRLIALALPFALLGCDGTIEDAGSVAYEGRSELTVSASEDPIDATTEGASSRSLDGRYGVSAADCDTGNRYMTEYVEIDGPNFAYRGQESTIAIVRDDAIVLRGGEELARARDSLARWPDQPRKRTTYTRCPKS